MGGRQPERPFSTATLQQQEQSYRDTQRNINPHDDINLIDQPDYKSSDVDRLKLVADF